MKFKNYKYIKIFCFICIFVALALPILKYFYGLEVNVGVSAPRSSTSTNTTTNVNGTTSTTTNTTSPNISNIFPLNYNFGLAMGDSLFSKNHDEVVSELDDISSMNVGWVRIDMDWSEIQPDNSRTFKWAPLDRIVYTANARGIKVLPILAYTPSWARVSDCNSVKCEPQDPDAFAKFASAAAERYSPKGIHAWEIWNEPNLVGFWKPAPNEAHYAKLLKAASVAIKDIDPSSTIITGGLASAGAGTNSIPPITFLSGIYENGAGPYFDVVGYHSYTFPVLPSNDRHVNSWREIEDTDPSLRSVMADHEDSSKKIWITEIGAPTGGPVKVTEKWQSETFIDALNLSEQAPWIGPLFWYSYKDIGINQDSNENFFGILRFDGSAKPVYNEIKDAAQGKPL